MPPNGPPPATPLDEVVEATQVSPTQPSEGSGDTGGATAGSSSGTTVPLSGTQQPTTRTPLAPYPSDYPQGDDCPWYEHMGGNLHGVYAQNLCTRLPYKLSDLKKKGITDIHKAHTWGFSELPKRRKQWQKDYEEYQKQLDTHDEL